MAAGRGARDDVPDLRGGFSMSTTTEKRARADKKVECYPTLSVDLIEQIERLSVQIGKTKTAFAARIAHWSLWNHAALDQLRPYFQFAVALSWDTNERSNTFHVWMPDREGYRDIRPVIGEEQEQVGRRFKFRISQEDRRRIQIVAYALNVTKVDSLWPVLLPLVLLDDRALYAVTQSRDATARGFHPLLQEWIEATATGKWRDAE